MPNRIVREGILDSERVNLLSEPAEVFYRRVMSAADDLGRMDARPSVLIARCYPLRADTMTAQAIESHLSECINAGLIVTYQVAGKGYLLIVDFGQRVRRDTAAKYPCPNCSALDCHQQTGECEVSAAIRRDPPRSAALRGSRDDSDSVYDSVRPLTSTAVDVDLNSEEPGARCIGRPTREAVRALATKRGRAELADPYYDARESTGWRKGLGRAAVFDYRTDFAGWVRAYDENHSRGSPNRSAVEDVKAHTMRILEEAGIGE